ncbi:hypothetical protein [Bacillus velezensis]|uniref:hypothetical protein n=1 Tax=Bacillus velezensis TaxID=492670 RepID=UPI001F3332E0|nr:hypothetical protein [Bacillus velezensis]
MAVAILMTKDHVTIYEDKDRKKKSGVTALTSQTKAAQKLLQCDKNNPALGGGLLHAVYYAVNKRNNK